MEQTLRMDNKKTAAAIAFALVFLVLSLYRAYIRPAYVQAAAVEQSATTSFDEDRRLPLTIVGRQEPPFVKRYRDDLEIPLPQGVTRNDLLVENHWTTGEIRVHFSHGAAASYLEEVIHADPDKVLTGTLVPDGADGMVLCFTTDRVYEVTSHYESDALSGKQVLALHFTPPQELYDKVVVIDPVGGGDDAAVRQGDLTGKEIALFIAETVRERLEDDLKTTGVKVYTTRSWDEAVSDTARIALSSSVDADLYLRIGVTEDASRAGIAVSYNEVYFARGLNNAAFADMTLRHVAVATGCKAAGLYPAYGSDAVLTALTIPAAYVSVGALTDEADVLRLARDNDLRRVADGIYKAVLEAAALL